MLGFRSRILQSTKNIFVLLLKILPTAFNSKINIFIKTFLGVFMTAALRWEGVGGVYGALCDCRNFIQKSSSNSLHHGTLSRVHTGCFCCRMRTTLYIMDCRPQEFLIKILIFKLKAVGKIFSKRTKIFFVYCHFLENVYTG